MDLVELIAALPRTHPFDTYDWEGTTNSLDGTPTSEITPDDVAEVVHAGDSGDTWDGEVAAVMRLHDGRYVAYETFFGPTGDGFSKDAYGGDAILFFAASLEVAVSKGLTDDGRVLCGIQAPQQIPAGARRQP